MLEQGQEYSFSFKTERIIKNIEPKTFIITAENGEAEDKNYTLKFVLLIHDGLDFDKELKNIENKTDYL